MSLEQLRRFLVGVLKQWFHNKPVIDKIQEDEHGNLLFKNKKINRKSSAVDNILQEDEDGILLTRAMLQDIVHDIVIETVMAMQEVEKTDKQLLTSADEKIPITQDNKLFTLNKESIIKEIIDEISQ